MTRIFLPMLLYFDGMWVWNYFPWYGALPLSVVFFVLGTFVFVLETRMKVARDAKRGRT